MERRKNKCYLVFADKNEVFLFSKGINIKRLAFAKEAHVPLKEPQNIRRLSGQ